MWSLLLVYTPPAQSQVNVLRAAHSHNDYEKREPLREAIHLGFTSVEADVHLTQDNRLLVGHDTVHDQSPEFESLYLDPLLLLIRIRGGRIYQDTSQPFWLMVDIKTDGRRTTEELLNVLQARYSRFLQKDGPVRIILSGNVPKPILMGWEFRGLLIDGRPSDLGKGISPERMPWISDRFSAWGTSQNGQINEESLEKIRKLAERVHAEGKQLRLWAIPDGPEAWAALLQAGVDRINTDHLEQLSEFLSRY